MRSMGTRALTSRAWLRKGEGCPSPAYDMRCTLISGCRFGWVNASYVYGLTIVNAHMKRALGALTPWDTFQRMTESGELHE